MSRVRNADEFLLRFRRISDEYKRIFGPDLAKLRSQYTARPEKKVIDKHLEVHARTYFVNAFLAALNWRLDKNPTDGLPNLVPELPVRSASTGKIRFLDYFGFERETDRPLLIVETKRPSASLPPTLTPAATYSEIVSRGLAGEELNGEWNEWLDTLRDYVRSVHQKSQGVPRRVVITNGDWLILFLEPELAFLQKEGCSPSDILVFKNREDIERQFTEIFRYLEHQQVLRKVPLLTPGELPFFAQEVDRVMHGLRLRYVEVTGIYQREPMIRVAPVIWLRTRYSVWLRVESPPCEYRLARGNTELQAHLNEVQQAAQRLLAEVNEKIGTSLQAYPLTQHYEDEDAFAALPGVQEQERDEYLLVTGDETHYLLQDQFVVSCPYHDWTACQRDGVPFNPRPIVDSSVSPRSFFVSGDLHHCAHRDVRSAKASQITAVNRIKSAHAVAQKVKPSAKSGALNNIFVAEPAPMKKCVRKHLSFGYHASGQCYLTSPCNKCQRMNSTKGNGKFKSYLQLGKKEVKNIERNIKLTLLIKTYPPPEISRKKERRRAGSIALIVSSSKYGNKIVRDNLGLDKKKAFLLYLKLVNIKKTETGGKPWC